MPSKSLFKHVAKFLYWAGVGHRNPAPFRERDWPRSKTPDLQLVHQFPSRIDSIDSSDLPPNQVFLAKAIQPNSCLARGYRMNKTEG